MSAPRGNLQKALCQYALDTLSYISTVKEFSKRLPEWIDARRSEWRKMTDMKDRGDSEGHEKLEQELAAVLKDTLGGLEKLDCFLDAVERLAVTSLHVFNENRVLHLPQEISPDTVQLAIIVAWLVCPLLLEFKRDAKAFFLPKLLNVEVLAYQLDKYIQTAQKISDKLKKGCFSEFSLKTAMDTVVDLHRSLSEADIQRMLCHINQLNEIRMDPHFWPMSLFPDASFSGFISEFSKRKPEMLQFLKDLEECAVHLDSMNKGAKISSVVGSSVGATGGVLSILGLALIPFTAGASLALTMTGVGLGITSGVNSAVTTATELGVNNTYQKKASKTLQSFSEDVQSVQDCLDEVTNREVSQKDVAVGVGKVLWNVGGIVKNIRSLRQEASALKMLKNGELIEGAGRVSRVASDIPDIGQAAVKGSLGLSKTARVATGALNALFVGMDVFFICKDSVSLAKGSETEISKFLRARAALWSSEIDSWQKIYDSLSRGLQTSGKKRAILEKPFYGEK